MTHMYFSARAEGRISYGHLGRTYSCSIKYSWCKLKRNVSQMPILILLSFKILAARQIILTESYNLDIGHFDLGFDQGQG